MGEHAKKDRRKGGVFSMQSLRYLGSHLEMSIVIVNFSSVRLDRGTGQTELG